MQRAREIVRRSRSVAMWAQAALLVCLAVSAADMWVERDGVAAQQAPAVQAAPAAPALSLKPASGPGSPGQAPAPGSPGVAAPVSPAPSTGASVEPSVPVGRGGYVYLPEGRRDPFLAVIQLTGPTTQMDMNLPPLQRVSVAELTVIGIIWGGFGYTAMVQTPDGKGYTVQRGTRIGNNNGVVSAITDKAVIVEERFTDIYGKKQVREYAKLLHAKEGLE